MSEQGSTCPRKLRGGKKIAVLTDLAQGDLSHKQLSIKYEVHVNTIHGWSTRHSEEIDEIREQLYTELINELSGSWAADKIKRVREYTQDIDDLNELMESDKLSVADRAKLIEKKHKALHAVAEEMNELPVRVKVEPPVGTVVWNSPDVAL